MTCAWSYFFLVVVIVVCCFSWVALVVVVLLLVLTLFLYSDKMREDHTRAVSDKEYEVQRVQRLYDQERMALTTARLEIDTLKVSSNNPFTRR